MFSSVLLESWQEKVLKELKDVTADPFLWRETIDGLPVKALYTEQDCRPSSLQLPGGDWIKCQRYDSADLSQVKKDITADLAADMDGLWLFMDKSVRLGGAFQGDGVLLWKGFEDIFTTISKPPKYIRVSAGSNSLAFAAAFQKWAIESNHRIGD